MNNFNKKYSYKAGSSSKKLKGKVKAEYERELNRLEKSLEEMEQKLNLIKKYYCNTYPMLSLIDNTGKKIGEKSN